MTYTLKKIATSINLINSLDPPNEDKGWCEKGSEGMANGQVLNFVAPFSNTSAKTLKEPQIFLINGFANIRTTFHQPGSRWWNSASSSYSNLSLSFVVLVETMNICSSTQVLSLDSSPVLLMERKENRATEQCSGKIRSNPWCTI